TGTASTYTVAGGATLEMISDALTSYQGTFTGSGAGVVRLTGGTLQLTADTTFNFPAGLLHWTGSGTIDTNGQTLTNAGSMTIDGSANLMGNDTLSNAGAIVAATSAILAFSNCT